MRVSWGFTGTRHGGTARQLDAFAALVARCKPTVLHHGCCIGADEEACEIADFAGVVLIGHPPSDTKLMSERACDLSVSLWPPKWFLGRNLDIVKCGTDRLVAMPIGPELRQSGTWYTVRAARRDRRPVTTIWPSGEVTEEEKRV